MNHRTNTQSMYSHTTEAAVLLYTNPNVSYRGEHQKHIAGAAGTIRPTAHRMNGKTVYSLTVVDERSIDAVVEATNPVWEDRVMIKLDGTSMAPGYLRTQAAEQVDPTKVVKAYFDAKQKH